MKTKTDTTVSVLALLLILWICLSGSCKPTTQDGQGKDQAGQPAVMVEDTQKIEQIESLISAISTSPTVHNAPANLVPFQQDTIGYWVVNGEPARIELKLYPPQQMIWQTYFMHEGKLVFVRTRYMQEVPDSSYANESMIYLDQERAFFCKERHMDLSQGQNLPTLMIRTPLETSTRSIAEIEEDYMMYWPRVREAVMEHFSLLQK